MHGSRSTTKNAHDYYEMSSLKALTPSALKVSLVSSVVAYEAAMRAHTSLTRNKVSAEIVVLDSARGTYLRTQNTSLDKAIEQTLRLDATRQTPEQYCLIVLGVYLSKDDDMIVFEVRALAWDD
jgi:hypothetical protein